MTHTGYLCTRPPLSKAAWGLFVALALTASVVRAESQEQPSGKPEGQPLWELGGFGTVLSQQAYPGSSQSIARGLVLPFFVYRGQYLRAERGAAGLRAIKTDRTELDIGFSAALGSTSSEIDARNGMPDLGTLIEFGPRIKWKLGPGPGQGTWRADLALRGVFDLTDKFKDKGLALEPELVFERTTTSRWQYATAVGLVFGDQRLADTFYGVAPEYAIAGRPAYAAQAGLIYSHLSISAGRSITPNLRLGGYARVSSVAGSANADSPLVRQNTGTTFGLGLVYTFARSSRLAVD